MNFKLIGTGFAAALSLLAISFTAEAADMPRPVYKGARSVIAYYNWTGFYAGINAGYAWGTSNWDSPGLSIAPKGWAAGLTVGYNHQIGSVVLGVEGDIDWSNVKGSTTCYTTFSCETASRWMTTARLRGGYAIDRFLPYITGGIAYGDIKASTTNPAFPGASKSKLGWTAGAGLEYAFLGNWTAKVEYLYIDLGKFDCSTMCGPLINGANNVSFKENIVRVGLNYKFSGPIFTRW